MSATNSHTFVKDPFLSAVPATASEASRTATVKCHGTTKACVSVHFTKSAGTAITVTPYGSVNNGETYGRLQSRNIKDGVGTCSTYTDQMTVSASTALLLEYDTSALTHLKLVFSVTGGGSGDLLTVYAATSQGA